MKTIAQLFRIKCAMMNLLNNAAPPMMSNAGLKRSKNVLTSPSVILFTIRNAAQATELFVMMVRVERAGRRGHCRLLLVLQPLLPLLLSLEELILAWGDLVPLELLEELVYWVQHLWLLWQQSLFCLLLSLVLSASLALQVSKVRRKM